MTIQYDYVLTALDLDTHREYKEALYPPHTLSIRKRFDRARSVACESLVCAGSIAYDLIACRAIASDQDSLDIIE